MNTLDFATSETAALAGIRKKSTLQLPFQNFADKIGIGFALGEFHHLALERIERGHLARLRPPWLETRR